MNSLAKKRAKKAIAIDRTLEAITVSVTDMMSRLKWPTPQERRHVNRLSLFHKIVHQLPPPYKEKIFTDTIK